MSTPQLPLSFTPSPHQCFDQFVQGENADALGAVFAVVADPEPRSVFLFGPDGAGKSHLLVAAARRVEGSIYLPLGLLGADAEAALSARGDAPLVCIDDVHAIAGERSAEIALFDLYNRCRDSGGRVLLAARQTPLRLPLVLRDLASRLAASATFAVKPLDEDARREVLRARAAERGFELDDAVIDFLFRRHARDLGALLTLLDHVDKASLAEQRRVTVPFLRRLIGLRE
jgi:DnaA family protein